jgi:nicotinamidase-related amidase
VKPKPGDTIIEKSASDSFYQTTLAAELETLGVQDLVICGLQTEFCVDATARAALSRGYHVTLASDAHSTGDAITPAETTIQHHNYALGNLAHPNGPIKIQTSDQITFVE